VLVTLDIVSRLIKSISVAGACNFLLYPKRRLIFQTAPGDFFALPPVDSRAMAGFQRSADGSGAV
jgi:hypothetical protein